MKTRYAACIASICVSQLCQAGFVEEMTPAEVLSFRTYVFSEMLDAKVGSCSEKLPSWNIEFPNVLENWKGLRTQQIAEGRMLFEKMVTSNNSGKPMKSLDELLAEVRAREKKDLAAFGSDHFVTTCLAIGRELAASNNQTKPKP
jgi:hypothetical protein